MKTIQSTISILCWESLCRQRRYRLLLSYLSPSSAQFADGDCGEYDKSFNVKSECVALSKCPEALDSPTAPYENLPCGFDTDLSQLKICCPTQNVTEPQVSLSYLRAVQLNLHYQDLAQPPRFPARSGKARTVEDKTEFCSKWKRHGACELDRDFSLSEEDDLNAQVYSKQMFDLMQKTCPKTCGWVESGCHDEHPRCQEWARETVSAST